MKEPTIKDVLVTVKDLSVSINDVYELLEKTTTLALETRDKVELLSEDVTDLKTTVASLPNKAYIDQKFAEYSADHDTKAWRAHQSLVEVLSDKVKLQPKDIKHLKKARFIRPTA